MKRDVTIQMSESMEATPIAHLVQLANKFDSRLYFEMGERRVNAKSIMGMMSLILSSGTTVTIDAEGADEEMALDAMSDFLTT